jgi:hypothetical protein
LGQYVVLFGLLAPILRQPEAGELFEGKFHGLGRAHLESPTFLSTLCTQFLDLVDRIYDVGRSTPLLLSRNRRSGQQAYTQNQNNGR